MFTSPTPLVCYLPGNILNKNDCFAIIGAKYVETYTMFGLKCLPSYYFNYISDWPILAVQIRPKLVIAKTSKMVYFWGQLNAPLWYLQNWRCQVLQNIEKGYVVDATCPEPPQHYNTHKPRYITDQYNCNQRINICEASRVTSEWWTIMAVAGDRLGHFVCLWESWFRENLL